MNKIIQYKYDVGWGKGKQNIPINKHISLAKTRFNQNLLKISYFSYVVGTLLLEVSL